MPGIGDVGPVKTDRTGSRWVRACDGPQKSGFPSAVCADESQYLAFGDRKRNLTHGLQQSMACDKVVDLDQAIHVLGFPR